jgi:hypothetical protein
METQIDELEEGGGKDDKELDLNSFFSTHRNDTRCAAIVLFLEPECFQAMGTKNLWTMTESASENQVYWLKSGASMREPKFFCKVWY